MAFIAIEEHWSTPKLAAALKGLPAEARDDSVALNEMGDNLERLEDIGDARIAAMDEQGIDLQILSLAPPATGPLRPADAAALSRETNDLAAESVRRNPSRLRAMSTLPMAEPAAVAGELERAARLGFVGAMVYGRTGETPLTIPATTNCSRPQRHSGSRSSSIHRSRHGLFGMRPTGDSTRRPPLRCPPSAGDGTSRPLSPRYVSSPGVPSIGTPS